MLYASRTNPAVETLSFDERASYIIGVEEGTYYAINGKTGDKDYSSNADAGTVTQYTITALSSTGGTIFLRKGTYVWSSVPSFPKSIPRWLKITGEGGTVIQLSTNAPRAFDFNRTADYDTFQFIWLESFTVDCNNVGGKHHVIIGTYVDNVVTNNINVNHIVVRDVKTINVPVDSSETNTRYNIWIAPNRTAGNLTLRDMWFEGCDFNGGNMGIVIGANSATGGRTVFVDNIHIHKCKHSLLSLQTAEFASSNFHIAANGYGGSVHISDCYGEYSGDVGVEIDAMETALVENTIIVDAKLANFYHRHSSVCPLNPDAQRITFRNCHAKIYSQKTTCGFSFQTSGSTPLGTVVMGGCSVYRKTADWDSQTDGLSVSITSAGMRELQVNSFLVTLENINYAGTESITPSVIFINGHTSNVLSLTLRDIYIKVTGQRSGTGSVSYRGIELNGNLRISLDDIEHDFNVTGLADGSTRIIGVGMRPNTTVSGTIRQLYVVRCAGDGNPTGIAIGSASLLTIPDQIRIEDCNFQAMTVGTEVLFDAPSNAGRVYFYGNKWRTFPPAASSITVGASPFTYQNLDGYVEYVIVKGGNVSKIELSRDGSTFYDIGETQGVFTLEPCDYIRVTYSGAPTMTKIPAR